MIYRAKTSFIYTALAAVILSCFLFFTSLDKKIFDIFLRILPMPVEDQSLYILTLDDPSIDSGGGFPFRRDVMGDIIVFLTEMNVKTIAFDLSFLDENPSRFDLDYAQNIFFQYSDTIDFSMNPDELKQEFRSLIPYLYKDVDEYFAQAIAFTGNTVLTLTMIPLENIIDGYEIEQQESDIDRYIAEKLALNTITTQNDTKTPEMVGIIPAIQTLMTRAKGAGFVNSDRDQDGVNRRIHLLTKYRDSYYPHLSLAALQQKLGYDSIHVTDKLITLIIPGGDIHIPRAQDGSILLRWPQKTFFDYLQISLSEFIQYNNIESVFVQNLALMNDLGFFNLYMGHNPYKLYVQAEHLKIQAFSKNQTAPAEWFTLRELFIKSCDEFLNGLYREAILTGVAAYPDLASFVNELFYTSTEQYEQLQEIRTNASGLSDSIVIIGANATSMTDYGVTPFQKDFPLVGTYAVVCNMLLSGDFLQDAHWSIAVLIGFFLSFFVSFMVKKLETLPSIIFGILIIIALSLICVTFFYITRIYLGLAVPLVSVSLSFISMVIFKLLTTNKERAFLHGAFSRYLAPEVISDIIKNPDKLNLGGEKRDMTALFTDIQGFSTISEQLDPTQLVKLLNMYLTAMSNIIMENVGTIDKYEGDAIIAFFGAPLYRNDHAALAIKSAIAMKEAESELNNIIIKEKIYHSPLFTRIGINSGEMIVGNMGAENKMNYTIMGNSVNLAARLEGVNKHYQTRGILVSEYTRKLVDDEFLFRQLDRVRVVGIKTALRLYEVLGLTSTVSQEEKHTAALWDKAITLYENRQFAQAQEFFSMVYKHNTNDGTASLFLKRCSHYMREAPAHDWDAVSNLTEK